MYRLVLIGYGSLGIRHLESLLKIQAPFTVDVFDISPVAMRKLRAFLRRTRIPKDAIVSPCDSIDMIKGEYDMAIISNTADARPGAIMKLKEKIFCKFWLIEKMLAQSVEKLDALEESLINDNVWVNCPFFYYQPYSYLRQEFDNDPLIGRVSGFKGLACNAVHYLDLIGRWRNETVVNITAPEGLSAWYPSKRDGFFEVDGTLSIEFSAGSRLQLAVDPSEYVHYEESLQLGSSYFHYKTFQDGSSVCTLNGKKISHKIQMQSDLTSQIFESLINTGKCLLPSLSESCMQHRPLLEFFCSHWDNSALSEGTVVPIT